MILNNPKAQKHFIKRFTKTSIAQGTIEYLLIIAIIVVIGLAISVLATNLIDSPTTQITSSKNKIGNITSGSISIVDAILDIDGDSLITLKNNSTDAMTLTRISVGTVDNDFSEQLVGLESKTFSLTELSSGCVCLNGQKNVSCIFVINYTQNGVAKTGRFTKTINCVTNLTGTSNGRDPIYPTNLPFTCGSIASLEGYTLIDECSDISDAGNYLFTDNMTCNITINADDININGNYCTLTGNIIGNTDEDMVRGYNFNLINLTANDVNSNGISTIDEYGSGNNGGIISLTNSSVNFITVNGGNGTGDASGGHVGVGGAGGSIIFLDSNSNNINANGGSGYRLSGGAGGNITLSNSNSNNITANGGLGYSSGGGVGGNVTLSNSRVLETIDVNGGTSGSESISSGNGGVISLTNSSVQSLYSTAGHNSSYGGCGNAGTITLNDSNSVYVFANGCSSGGEGENSYSGGNGGTINLNNANGLINISATGGDGFVYGGGNGGIVIFSPAECPEDIIIDISEGISTGEPGSVTPTGCGQ